MSNKKEETIYKSGLIDLAQPRLNTKVVYKTDDFFAAAHRIIDPNPPVWKEGVFDQHGKWMDGWESRRKRGPGHDYLILELGKAGNLERVEVDTTHFNGNQPESVSLEGCYLDKGKKGKSWRNADWSPILPKKKTGPDQNHIFKIKNNKVFSHIRFNIFPDGGVARLRLLGNIHNAPGEFRNQRINLASIVLGASIIACNNEHFGKAENILAPGKGINMGDGWETRRRRGGGFDWIIIKCVEGKEVDKIEISTDHFKGNFPGFCSLQAAYISGNPSDKTLVSFSKNWKPLLKKSPLSAHKNHVFQNQLMKKNKINYVKLNIFPDGGISRIRVYGKGL